MLRNWVVQFGHAPGIRAGDERISPADRGKYIAQIGNYYGWNPPPGMSWIVEITKDLNGKHPGRYIACFMRYVMDSEAEKLLGTNYDDYSHLNPQYEHLAADVVAQQMGCDTSCTTTTETQEVVEVENTNQKQDILNLLNIK